MVNDTEVRVAGCGLSEKREMTLSQESQPATRDPRLSPYILYALLVAGQVVRRQHRQDATLLSPTQAAGAGDGATDVGR